MGQTGRPQLILLILLIFLLILILIFLLLQENNQGHAQGSLGTLVGDGKDEKTAA